MGLKFGDRVVNRRATETIVINLPACRKVAPNWMLHPIQGEALGDSSKPQAVITVKMGDQHFGDRRRRNIGKDHLALGSFTRIKEEAFLIPPKKIAIVVAVAGRHLARSAEGDQFADAHLERGRLSEWSCGGNVFTPVRREGLGFSKCLATPNDGLDREAFTRGRPTPPTPKRSARARLTNHAFPK